ncbi:glycosyltransferase family 61 protein [Hydrogenophaga sp. NH-16]|uniref:glycosyltransferase 61 family protein n=1 Tax=Hydrogenophaga sp. NH-16 TaxID=2184519 RepID=UPI000FDC3AC1|nr:glycosyltransferase family 61 protein [Hydrogenophaga sp. NH-16]
MKLQRLTPLINSGLKLLRRSTALDLKKVRCEVVCPEEVEVCQPLVYLEGQLEKATAPIQGFDTLANELAILKTTEVRHAPTLRYTVFNCIVHEAGFDVVGGTWRKKSIDRMDFLTQPITELQTLSYCMTSVSHRYFGHWLQDAYTSALLAPPEDALLLDVRAESAHAADYVNAAGLKPLNTGVYFARQLHFYQDYGQGPSKRARIGELRARLASAISDDDRFAKGASVYFRRGTSGVARVIENEDELMRALESIGFEIFHLEGASVADIQQRFRHARRVISIEGSQQCHLTFAMPRGSTLISLIPADRFSGVLIGYARAIGLKWGCVVIDRANNGYRVNIDDVLKTLDIIER